MEERVYDTAGDVGTSNFTTLESRSSLFWREFEWKNIVGFLSAPAQRISQRGCPSCCRSCGNNKATDLPSHFKVTKIKYRAEGQNHERRFEALSVELRAATMKGSENKSVCEDPTTPDVCVDSHPTNDPQVTTHIISMLMVH